MVGGDAIDQILNKLGPAHPAVIFALPCIDTMKEINDEQVKKTVDRSKLYRAQTPQGVLTDLYKKPYCK